MTMLVADDYPLLLASLPAAQQSNAVFNPGSLLLSTTSGPRVSQWALGPQGLSKIEDWTITALAGRGIPKINGIECRG